MNGEQFFRLLGEVDDQWIEEASQVRRPVPWRTILLSAAAACLCLVVALYAGTARPAVTPSPGGDNGVQIPNPIESWETAEELSQAVGFEVLLPTQLPEGYQLEELSSINRQMAEARYSSDAGSIVYRVSAELEEVSGDYAQHSQQTEITVGELSVTLQGDGEGWVTATWTNGDLHCALLAQPGQTEEALCAIIASIQ